MPLAETEHLPPASIAIDPWREDAYWSEHFRARGWARDGFDYEDYAPAYCVGYVGYAQYGGRYEDAERSLCANWVRIKGDSRLDWEAARGAMRAAWDRVQALAADAVVRLVLVPGEDRPAARATAAGIGQGREPHRLPA